MRSRLQPRSSRTFRPHLEALEDRWMPANVTATVDAGVLQLTAVSADSVEGLSLTTGSIPGSVAITPTFALDTTVNNSVNPVLVKGVRSVRVVLRGGDDVVAVGGLTLSGSLTVLGGGGANAFFISNSHVGGNLTVINGNTPAGQDLTYINNVVLVAGRTTISNGAGESLVDVFNDVDLTGGLTINGGQSDDIVWLRNARLSGNLRVNLGAGRNSAFIFKFYLSGSAFLTTGPGDDGIAMNEVTVGGGVTAGLGNGINLFSIDPYPEGFASTTGSRIAGQLSVTTGSGRDSVRIGGYAPVWVGGPVAIRTGNEVNSLGDAVNLNDVTCADAVLIELGDGSDLLEVDTNTTPVMAACNFGGAFTLRGGGGTETVYLGSNSEAARKVNFARAPILNSGGASDDYLSRRNYSIGGVDAAPFTPINFEIIQP